MRHDPLPPPHRLYHRPLDRSRAAGMRDAAIGAGAGAITVAAIALVQHWPAIAGALGL